MPTTPQLPTSFDFVWQVPDGGFRWYHVKPTTDVPLAQRGPYHSPGAGTEPALLPAAPPTALRQYEPLKEFPGLFLTLADTPENEPGVLAFANMFGDLGIYGSVEISAPWPGLPEDFLLRPVLLRDWKPEIQRLRPLVNLYRAIRQGSEEERAALHTQIFEYGCGIAFVDPFRASPVAIEHPDLDPVDRKRLGPVLPSDADDLTIGRAVLRKEIDQALSERSSHLRPLLTHEDLVLTPQTLLGAIWLQFALAVAHDAEFRRCAAEDCPRGWFEISTAPLGLRPEARFCSAQCRHRSKKARKKQHTPLEESR
jgi:hypothetical protein